MTMDTTASLARDSADALATFRENLAAIHTRDKARDLHIGVPTPGDTLTGVSTRVFVRTPEGMRITVTSSWNDVPTAKRP